MGDRLREVMIRDRGTMRQDLERPEHELEREVEETAKHASSGELAGGEQPARTAKEVFVDRDQIAALDNALENRIGLEQEQAQPSGTPADPGSQ